MSEVKPKRLVEGVDYYMEGSKFVFTSAYHLKRGYCCNSRCRHCPYGTDGGLGAHVRVTMGPQAAPNPGPAGPAQIMGLPLKGRLGRP